MPDDVNEDRVNDPTGEGLADGDGRPEAPPHAPLQRQMEELARRQFEQQAGRS